MSDRVDPSGGYGKLGFREDANAGAGGFGMNVPLVSVCVCTYMRPAPLASLLASLAAQVVHNFGFEVIVIDNDARASARAVVESASRCHPDLPVRYGVEPIQGISHARNRSVELSRGQFIAFIDDDEEADANWLSALVDTARRCGCDAVLGPVIPIFPDGTPEWIIASRFFERARHETGTIVSPREGRTSNALIRADWVRSGSGSPFDTALAHSGSEDYDLFRRMHGSGARIRWCDEAIVRELVPHERQRLVWMLERSLRSSITYWRLNEGERFTAARGVRVAVGAFGAGALAVLGLFALPAGREYAIRCWVKAAGGLGRVLALTKVRLAGYRGKRVKQCSA